MGLLRKRSRLWALTILCFLVIVYMESRSEALEFKEGMSIVVDHKNEPVVPKKLVVEIPKHVNELSEERHERIGELFGFPRLTEPKDEQENTDSDEEGLYDDEEAGDGFLQCLACDPPDCHVQYICGKAVQCYKSQNRDSLGTVRVGRGCIEKIDKVSLVCQTKKHTKASTQAYNDSRPDYTHLGMYTVQCCSDADFCNDGEFPELPISAAEHQATTSGEEGGLSEAAVHYISAILIVVFFGVTITAIFVLRVRRTHKKRMATLLKPRQDFMSVGDDLQAKPAGDSTLKEYIDGSMTSGSGSGLPLLIQRTLAKNIQLRKCIGKGRYGEVWQAVWNCENVAVKIFSTRDEASWIRETEIYSTVMLRHENILGFYGSDMISRNSVTQLWLVTHYHRFGSLYDYLNDKTLTQVQLLKFAYSVANGLAFLHSEMVGTESRAGIAHRDIKSKNILVSSAEQCVIADFGLAVTHKRDTGELNVFPNPKVGTRRYMAPEILDESINMKSFDAFKRVDMYAFALVLWEMSRRTASQANPEDYQPPFFDIVPSDPSFEDMKKVVCDDEYRPMLPNRWHSDPVLSYFARLIKESWHQNPHVRLSALRVKKSIAIIAQEKFKGVLDAASV